MKNPCAGALFMLGMLFALLAVSAHAQNATVQSGQAQPLQMEGHPQHAAQHMLGTEQSLLGTDATLYAQGEQPLSEFGGEPQREVPLGDIARYYRNHPYVPKETDNGNGHDVQLSPSSR